MANKIIHSGLVLSAILVCIIVQNATATEDVVIQILSKRFVNKLSDKYISFSIDAKDLQKGLNGSAENLARAVTELGPSYLKITGDLVKRLQLTNTKDSSLSAKSQISNDDWKRMYKMIRSMNLTPVITLPYNPKNWNTRQAMEILSSSNDLGIEECIWQLGSELNTTDSINYVDDLSTLRTIVDAFTAQNKKNNWSVVGTDLSAESNEDEARLYSELSQEITTAIGWEQSPDHSDIDSMEDIFSLNNKEMALRTILNGRLPVWLSLLQSPVPSTPTKTCSPQCQSQGISWARTLGDAAHNGFKVVYKPIELKTLSNPSLSYYITLLYKKLIGGKVFDTRVLAGSRMSSHVYSYCTHNVSGGFTVMGINTDDSRLKIFGKMPSAYTGAEVQQYILTVNPQTGRVQLNGEDVTRKMQPTVKVKRPTKAISFMLPPLSVGFWVFPHANLRECIKLDVDSKANEQEWRSLPKTSKELLLQRLIIESMKKGDAESESAARTKRHTIIKKDSSVHQRHRRDVDIPIHEEQKAESTKDSNSELNAENSDSSIYKRQRRFIANANRPRRSGNLMDALYNEVDDVKRKHIFSPYTLKNGPIFAKHSRNKRQLPPGLSKLFQKFEMMKPKKLDFKPKAAVPFKKGSIAIPPIATVYDMYTPSSAERKVFRSSENKNLPRGDVFFELGTDAQSPDYVTFDENEKPSGHKSRHQDAGREVPDDAAFINVPNEYFEHMPADYGRQRAMNAAPASPQLPRYGELWEADVYQRASAPQQHERNQRPEELPKAPQRQMEFIVQDLQPTWHKNRQNLMTTRNNLQQFYVSQGPQGQPIQIQSYANQGAEYGDTEPGYDSHENEFFRSRRRRSVDPKMNEEIEERIKLLEDDVDETTKNRGDINQDLNQHLNRAVDKINLLDKMLKIVDHIDRSKNDSSREAYEKLSAEIKDLEAMIFRRPTQTKKVQPIRKTKLSSTDIRRKCKIMASSLENKCLRDEHLFEKNMFKRDTKFATENKAKKPLGDIVKKLFPKTSAIIEKTKLREKRNAILKETMLDDDYIHPNLIPKETMGDDGMPVINTIIIRDHNSLSGEQLRSNNAHIDAVQNIPKTTLYDEKSPKTSTIIKEIRTEHIPKLIRTVGGYMDRVLSAVNRHVSGWWRMTQ